jgi:TetR/AcrR family transcriptional regulator
MPLSPLIWIDGLPDDDRSPITPAGGKTAKTPRRRRSQPARDADSTSARLLAAAKVEFARYGLMGARVDLIARRADVNKQLIYYHFRDKDGLYAAVLEEIYIDIRMRERQLDLGALTPEAAMRRLIEFSFDYVAANPAFVALLTDENVHGGVHLQNSKVLNDLRSPFVGLIAETLERGVAEGVFRPGVDPAQFYISFAGMSFFYFTNVHTLSALFAKDLRAPLAVGRRRAHILDFVMASLRP